MKTKIGIKEQARLLAARCDDSYSYDRYASWPAVAEMLLRRGYDERQAEAIMRSKWTRWAGDQSGNAYGRYTANDLARWMDKQKNLQQQVDELTRETFA